MGQTCIVVNSHLALLVVIADVRVDIILVWGKPGSVDSRGQWDKGDVGKLGPGGVDKVCTDGARGLWDVALPSSLVTAGDLLGSGAPCTLTTYQVAGKLNHTGNM